MASRASATSTSPSGWGLRDEKFGLLEAVRRDDEDPGLFDVRHGVPPKRVGVLLEPNPPARRSLLSAGAYRRRIRPTRRVYETEWGRLMRSTVIAPAALALSARFQVARADESALREA